MKFRNLWALISLSLLISLPATTLAQTGKDKAKSARENADRTEHVRSETEEAQAKRPSDAEDAMTKRSEEAQAKRPSDAEDPMTKRSEEARTKTPSNAKDAKTKGNEQAQEMRARRDERKSIKEEYKSDRTPGQEADSALTSDDDEDEKTEDAKEKPKKPWWKVWES